MKTVVLVMESDSTTRQFVPCRILLSSFKCPVRSILQGRPPPSGQLYSSVIL